MRPFIKKTLWVIVLGTVLELTTNLISKHIMQSEAYLSVENKINRLFSSHNIKHFKASKKSYNINESIHFNIELKQKSYLYLLRFSDKEVCLLFPNHNQQNNFQKSITIPSNSNDPILKTPKPYDEFHLLSSKKPLSFSNFYKQCTHKNSGIQQLETFKTQGVESLRIDVGIP